MRQDEVPAHVLAMCAVKIRIGTGPTKWEKKIMATLLELQESLAQVTELAISINTGMDAVLVKIDELKKQIGPVTQAQLDELAAALTSVKTELSEASAEVTSVLTPPPPSGDA